MGADFSVVSATALLSAVALLLGLDVDVDVDVEDWRDAPPRVDIPGRKAAWFRRPLPVVAPNKIGGGGWV